MESNVGEDVAGGANGVEASQNTTSVSLLHAREVVGGRVSGGVKMSHDKSRGSLLWRTWWASHFLGLPCCSYHPDPSVDGENSRSGPHPSGEGRGTLWVAECGWMTVKVVVWR